jgi:endonuclease/exonuclease/phosphatase family metal-dependent hydrolase
LHPGADPSTPIAWQEPVLARDRENISRWRSAVGSPILISTTSAPPATDRLLVVSWNIALGSGDIVRAVRDFRTEAPHMPIVLLLQEAFRSGDDIPASPSPSAAAFAGFLGSSNPAREIDDVARALGFSLYYVPSMRNGAPTRYREDRGNAILSSMPLEGLTAIELPFEHQRRVALAAEVRGAATDGAPWRLRIATVHLDNIAGARHAWIGGEFGRTRQARGLREALRGDDPLLLAGDFNTWFGFSDQAYIETAREYPQTRLTDTRRTFRGLLRLDHVFYRLPEGWTADVRRGESTYGSDHYPLVATITF